MLRYFALLAAVTAACSSGGDLIGPIPGQPRAPASTPPATTDTPDPTPDPATNHAPVAAADTFRLASGQTVVVVGLLANDADQDGDPLVAYPNGVIVTWEQTTGHVTYSGNIGSWEQDYTGGVAHAWNPSGGFSFTAAADFTGTVEIFYQAIEDGPLATPSAPAKAVILVE